MQYWKVVEAGDYKTYGKKFLEYYINNREKFVTYTNPYWNELNVSSNKEMLKLIPEMKEGLSKFGNIRDIALMILWNNNTQGLNAGVRVRMNIPIANYEGSRISFYKLTDEQYKNHRLSPGGSKMWPEEYKKTLKPFVNLNITEPTILNIPEPHTVFCDTEEYPRIVASVAFDRDLSYNLEI
jgi:hypothetical protein